MDLYVEEGSARRRSRAFGFRKQARFDDQLFRITSADTSWESDVPRIIARMRGGAICHCIQCERWGLAGR